MTSLLKNIFSFLLKESESFSGSISNLSNDNLLPQMSTISPPNNELSSKSDCARKASWILGKVFKYLDQEIVLFLKNLSRKERNNYLFKGFIIQLCRLVIAFEKRGHQIIKNNSHWKQVYYDFLYHEIIKEDRILVEDPRNKNKIINDHIGLPANFKINNASLQGKMNLKSNYDSLGNRGMILDNDDDEEISPKENVLNELDKHHKDSDSESDSDSDSESDEELLLNYRFGKTNGILNPKPLKMNDKDYSGYDSGTGMGVDLTSELPDEEINSFKKTPTEDLYTIVNDWNVYSSNKIKTSSKNPVINKYTSLKNLSKSLNKESDLKYKANEIINNLSNDKESENLQRHQITRSDNKIYGLYGSLTRRFQIKKNFESSQNKPNNKLEKFYDSANLNKQSDIQVER